MSTTRTKVRKRPENGKLAASTTVDADEVLTLPEAAAYLRIADAELVLMVSEQGLPGRLIGQEWRFLKSALQDWLRRSPPRSDKKAVLARIGNWQGDPYLEDELAEIHRRRGRK